MHTVRTASKYISVILLFLFIFIWPGCSVKKNYKVLSFFFDGVPKPDQETQKDKDTDKTAPRTQESIKPGKLVKIESRHQAYTERKCRECHNVKSIAFLKEKKAGLCFTCHKEEKYSGDYLHGPVAVGACLACHLPHESKYKQLLKLDVPALCIECHVTWDTRDVKAHSKEKACTQCHDPHAGDNRSLLKQAPQG
jgi:predicted CXXCH cytochrome family protein